MIDLSASWPLLITGFILGLSHAFEGDHVAAVSTIITQKKYLKDFFLLGGVWGIGHTLSLMVVGAVVLLFKVSVPNSFAYVAEAFVGIMLIVLGVRVVHTIRKEKLHMHVHKHDHIKHLHVHSHKYTYGHRHVHQSFFVGILHGLAGSAALVLLVLGTIDSFGSGMWYIVIFGIGSIMGMMVLSGVIGLPLVFFSRYQSLTAHIQYTAAGMSIIIGVSIIIEFIYTL